MPYVTCGHCGGWGTDHFGKTRTCLLCGGSGQVWSNDPTPGAASSPRGAARAVTPEEADRRFLVLIFLVTGGAAYFAIRHWQVEMWAKVAVAALAGVLVAFALSRIGWLTRLLRHLFVWGLFLGLVGAFFYALSGD